MFFFVRYSICFQFNGWIRFSESLSWKSLHIDILHLNVDQTRIERIKWEKVYFIDLKKIIFKDKLKIRHTVSNDMNWSNQWVWWSSRIFFLEKQSIFYSLNRSEESLQINKVGDCSYVSRYYRSAIIQILEMKWLITDSLTIDYPLLYSKSKRSQSFER